MDRARARAALGETSAFGGKADVYARREQSDADEPELTSAAHSRVLIDVRLGPIDDAV